MFLHTQHWTGLSGSLLHWRKGRGTCRTLAPTLFLQANDLRVRAEAVPRRAVVNSLEVGRDNVTHGQRGDDSFLGGHRLNGVAAWCSWLQHSLLPRPGLRKDKSIRKGCFWPSPAELSCEKQKYCEIFAHYQLFMCVGLFGLSWWKILKKGILFSRSTVRCNQLEHIFSVNHPDR